MVYDIFPLFLLCIYILSVFKQLRFDKKKRFFQYIFFFFFYFVYIKNYNHSSMNCDMKIKGFVSKISNTCQPKGQIIESRVGFFLSKTNIFHISDKLIDTRNQRSSQSCVTGNEEKNKIKTFKYLAFDQQFILSHTCMQGY